MCYVGLDVEEFGCLDVAEPTVNPEEHENRKLFSAKH
jgi:hypothetical protein